MMSWAKGRLRDQATHVQMPTTPPAGHVALGKSANLGR